MRATGVIGMGMAGVSLMTFGVAFFTQPVETPMWVLLTLFFVPTSELQDLALTVVQRANDRISRGNS